MKVSDLKKMRRSDLLEILLHLRKENDRLIDELEQARQELASRAVFIEESGSLAEAAIRINGVMEAAQKACSQYTFNVQKRCEEKEEYCRQLEQATKIKCEQMLLEAAQRAETIRCDASTPHTQPQLQSSETSLELLLQLRQKNDQFIQKLEQARQEITGEVDSGGK